MGYQRRKWRLAQRLAKYFESSQIAGTGLFHLLKVLCKHILKSGAHRPVRDKSQSATAKFPIYRAAHSAANSRARILRGSFSRVAARRA